MIPFNKLVRNIQQLQEVDPILCNRLRQTVYDIVGCCMEVHRDMGPYVNELMYQDALNITFEEHGITGENKKKEYYFTTQYHGVTISHPHKVDFFVNNHVFVECKAVEALCSEHRQQLWNYMRLTGVQIGILYNFAPFKDQCEKYYLDTERQVMFMF